MRNWRRLLDRRVVVAAPFAVAALLVNAMLVAAAPVDVDWFVVPIKQAKQWQCWAASTAMINNWVRDKTQLPRLTARDTAALGGAPLVALYDAGATTGITPAQELTFYQKIGFSVKRQENFDVAGWADLLRTHGPVGVTINIDPQHNWAVHEIVVTTIKGDGTADGTTVTYTDPADGLPHSKPFREFAKYYEGGAGYAIQVVYVP